MESDPAPDLHNQLQRAIALIQAGRASEARPLLEAVVAADPQQELAWLWLASASTDRAERIRFLERALAINPANETARAAYVQLTGEPFAPLAPPTLAPGRRAVTPGALLIGLAVIAVAVAALLVALYLRDGDSASGGAASTATPLPLISLTPTPAFSPTPSDTPRPTDTPGPSPTLVWDSVLPTWTAAPSVTAGPTRRVVTWTPRPPSDTPAPPSPAPSETPPAASASPSPAPPGEPAAPDSAQSTPARGDD